MQLFRFLPQNARVRFQQRLGAGDHAEEELGLACFLSAGADAEGVFFARVRVISLAIIRADAGPGADELINQTIVDGMLRHTSGEPDDSLPKQRRPHLEIERMRRALFPDTASFLGGTQAPKLQKVSISAH